MGHSVCECLCVLQTSSETYVGPAFQLVGCRMARGPPKYENTWQGLNRGCHESGWLWPSLLIIDLLYSHGLKIWMQTHHTRRWRDSSGEMRTAPIALVRLHDGGGRKNSEAASRSNWGVGKNASSRLREWHCEVARVTLLGCTHCYFNGIWRKRGWWICQSNGTLPVRSNLTLGNSLILEEYVEKRVKLLFSWNPLHICSHSLHAAYLRLWEWVSRSKSCGHKAHQVRSFPSPTAAPHSATNLAEFLLRSCVLRNPSKRHKDRDKVVNKACPRLRLLAPWPEAARTRDHATQEKLFWTSLYNG